MLYPWNARGTVSQLTDLMMTHERVEHCALIEQSIAG
jgi:hypothetical protein